MPCPAVLTRRAVCPGRVGPGGGELRPGSPPSHLRSAPTRLLRDARYYGTDVARTVLPGAVGRTAARKLDQDWSFGPRSRCVTRRACLWRCSAVWWDPGRAMAGTDVWRVVLGAAQGKAALLEARRQLEAAHAAPVV
eukprot:2971346-Rhodomonas_salina.2